MKDGVTIRRSRRGNRTTIRIVVKGKAAEELLQELIRKPRPEAEKLPSIEGGAH